ncbi:phospholipase A2 [Streptomyces monashensis]|uniref:phospholipase A2 n=1 Tax=Streptomyces monashensis TaxID=1678012 RepID=UPI0033FA1CB6
MRKCRPEAVDTVRRFSAIATVAAISLTGLVGITSTAYAANGPSPSSTTSPKFNVDEFHRINNESLDDFAKDVQKHNPEHKQSGLAPDENGIRWDTDGCSDPSGAFKGGDAEIACMRHDVNYRTLQQNSKWNAQSHADADHKLESDLGTLESQHRTSSLQGEGIYAGAAGGSRLPSSINGIPNYDGSSDSPLSTNR